MHKKILVLLYNKRPKESSTLCKLLDYYKDCGESLNIVVWNNGPHSIGSDVNDFFSGSSISFVLKETLNNQALSSIYNEFVDDSSTDLFVIFDDDSIPSDDYLSSIDILSADDVAIPKISNGIQVVNPKISGEVVRDLHKVTNEIPLMSLGSGLIIGQNVLCKFKQVYGSVFDERFFFYGVDTTFFIRLNRLATKINIMIFPIIKHSISIELKESSQVSQFRRIERSYDVALQFRYYYPLHTGLYRLLRLIVVDVILRRHYYHASSLFKGFIVGRHHRLKNDNRY